jgi:omega-6 fatty acid desaturase (delta-12 desaturase)
MDVLFWLGTIFADNLRVGEENMFARTLASQAARQWKSHLPATLRERRLWHGLWSFSWSLGGYLALFYGALSAPHPVIRLLCIAGMPILIGALFVVGHDAAHQSLTPVRWLNELLGRIAFLPAWHPYTSWVHAHNLLHHGWTNLKGKHPDFAPYSQAEYEAMPRWRQAAERFFRTPIGPGFNYVATFYLPHLFAPERDFRKRAGWMFVIDLVWPIAYAIGSYAFAYWWYSQRMDLSLHPAVVSALVAVLPWLVWIWFMGVATFVQHTHPRIAWYDHRDEWEFYHVQLKSTTHFDMPAVNDLLLNNIMDHAAHHLDPRIPLYSLKESQRRLETEAPEHAVVVPGTIREYFDICKRCKLYDYRKHQWTDFKGRPTSPAGLHISANDRKPHNAPTGKYSNAAV